MALPFSANSLQSRSDLLAVLENNIADVIWVIDNNQRYTYVTPSVFRMSGYHPEEIIGQQMNFGMTPESKELMDEINRRMFQKLVGNGGRPFELETVQAEAIRKDGTRFWVEIDRTFLTDENGSVNGAIAIGRDITSRRAAEMQLKLYEQMVSTTSNMMLFIGRDYVYQAANQAFLDLFGKDSSQIIGHSMESIHGSELFHGVLKKHLDECLAGKTVRYQEWIEYPAAGKRFLDVAYSPHRNQGGEVVSIVVNARDLTDFKYVERRYSRIFERAPFPMCVFSSRKEAFNIRAVNDALCRQFGYSREELVSKSALAVGAFTDLRELVMLDQIFERSGPILDYEIDIRRKDQSILTNLMYIQPFVNEHDENLYFVAFMDITDRKRAEKDLAQYRDQLEVLVEERTAALKSAQDELVRGERLAALGKLTASVAHEIRNPLSTVRAAVFSIAEAIREDRPEIAERNLQRAERSIVRCDRIIHELLTYSRDKRLALKPLDIDDWLNHLLDELEIPENITLHRCLMASVMVSIDAEQMRRAVVNVLNNAIQALQDLKPASGEIRILSEIADGKLKIHVADTGPGIAEDALHSIFEPLFSTKNYGVGLGLPIVHDIMTGHQGGIDVCSSPGEGTTMTLWIPLDPEIVTR